MPSRCGLPQPFRLSPQRCHTYLTSALLEHNGTLMPPNHRAVSNYAIVGGHYQLL